MKSIRDVLFILIVLLIVLIALFFGYLVSRGWTGALGLTGS